MAAILFVALASIWLENASYVLWEQVRGRVPLDQLGAWLVRPDYPEITLAVTLCAISALLFRRAPFIAVLAALSLAGLIHSSLAVAMVSRYPTPSSMGEWDPNAALRLSVSQAAIRPLGWIGGRWSFASLQFARDYPYQGRGLVDVVVALCIPPMSGALAAVVFASPILLQNWPRWVRAKPSPQIFE